jgi:hypothetical protein
MDKGVGDGIIEHMELEEEQIAASQRYVRKGNKLYQGGIEVYRSQLTEEEKRKYFPEVEKKKVPQCPCCDQLFDSTDLGAWRVHSSKKHSKWYMANKQWVDELKNFDQLIGYVKACVARKEVFF